MFLPRDAVLPDLLSWVLGDAEVEEERDDDEEGEEDDLHIEADLDYGAACVVGGGG